MLESMGKWEYNHYKQKEKTKMEETKEKMTLDQYGDYLREWGLDPSFITFESKVGKNCVAYAYFLKNEGHIDAEAEIVPLTIDSTSPLSTQLERHTGDSWNVIDFCIPYWKEMTAEKGEIIKHKHSNKYFQLQN